MGKKDKKKKIFNPLEALVDKKRVGGKRGNLNIVAEMMAREPRRVHGEDMLQKQEIEDQEQLAKLRQQKTYLEKVENERRKLELERKEKDRDEEAEESQEKQIIQLEKTQEKHEVLQKKQIRKLQGTREMGPRSKF